MEGCFPLLSLVKHKSLLLLYSGGGFLHALIMFLMNQSQASRVSGRFLFLVWMGLRSLTNDGSSHSISEGRLRGTSASTQRSGRATCDRRQHLILCRLWRGELRPVGDGRFGGGGAAPPPPLSNSWSPVRLRCSV